MRCLVCMNAKSAVDSEDGRSAAVPTRSVKAQVSLRLKRPAMSVDYRERSNQTVIGGVQPHSKEMHCTSRSWLASR